MNITDIITKKAANEELSLRELEFFIKGITDDSIKDYQISALVCAIYINGLSDRELSDLTLLMARSGDMLDLSEFSCTLDKHSSGGVGDKVSLIVTPIIASLGITVAKMSGRGLSHTGGTIDKLESINGFNVNLTKDRFFEILRKTGCAITSQTGNICYADKRIYALRDVTGLTASIPLIASSIMSKKIASGAEHIILDVKCGKGAFMKNTQDAKALSLKMVEIGKTLGRNVIAMITDMNEPLGYAVGNSLEVYEAVKVLKGEYVEGLSELCEEISVNALIMTKKAESREAALIKVKDALSSKKALLKFEEFVNLQGGDTSFIKGKSSLPLEKGYELKAFKNAYIKGVDSYKTGELAMELGGGRKQKEDIINYGVGILLNKKTGDYVEKGELLGTVYSKSPLTEEEKSKFFDIFEFSDEKVQKTNIIKELIL